MHKVISDYELDAQEKKELLLIIEKIIEPKPKPKNRASVKWAIKIYELLG